MAGVPLVACIVMFCLQSMVCGMVLSGASAAAGRVRHPSGVRHPCLAHRAVTLSAPRFHVRCARPQMASFNAVAHRDDEDPSQLTNVQLGGLSISRLRHATRMLPMVKEASVGWTAGPLPSRGTSRVAGPPLAMELSSDETGRGGLQEEPPFGDRRKTGRDERYCDSDVFNDGCNLPEGDEVEGSKVAQLRGEAVQTAGVAAFALIGFCFLSPLLR